MMLNPDKTEILILGPRLASLSEDEITASSIAGVLPQRKIKILGFIVNDKLSWEDYITHNVQECRGRVRMLHKTASRLPFRARKALFDTLVLCKLNYGDALFTVSPDSLRWHENGF